MGHSCHWLCNLKLLFLFPFTHCGSGARSSHFSFFISILKCLIELKRYRTLSFTYILTVMAVLCWSVSFLSNLFSSLSTKIILCISNNAICTFSKMVWIFAVNILSARCFLQLVGKTYHSSPWATIFKQEEGRRKQIFFLFMYDAMNSLQNKPSFLWHLIFHFCLHYNMKMVRRKLKYFKNYFLSQLY